MCNTVMPVVTDNEAMLYCGILIFMTHCWAVLLDFSSAVYSVVNKTLSFKAKDLTSERVQGPL